MLRVCICVVCGLSTCMYVRVSVCVCYINIIIVIPLPNILRRSEFLRKIIGGVSIILPKPLSTVSLFVFIAEHVKRATRLYYINCLNFKKITKVSKHRNCCCC